MKIIRTLIFTTVAVSSAPIITMETPPVPQLPADVIRYHIIPAVAETNTVRVIETIRSINATSRFFHEAIHSETVMLALLKRIPYISNAVYIARNNKIAQRHSDNSNPHTSFKIWQMQASTSLQHGMDFWFAVRAHNAPSVVEYLKNRNIQLYWKRNSLSAAAQSTDLLMVRILLNAGVYPGISALPCAVAHNAKEIVTCLLEAGANPFFDLKEYPSANAETRQLILDAQVKRRQRLLELQGKAGKPVVTSQTAATTVQERICIVS